MRRLRAPWEGVLSPLNLATGVVWVAVSVSTIDWAPLASGSAGEWLGLACLAAFLALFVLGGRCDENDAEGLKQITRLVVLQGVAAVAAIALLQAGMPSILLAVVVAQLFAMTPRRQALAWAAALNVGVLLCWLQWMEWPAALLTLLPVLAFQAFAALMSHYALSVERAHDELARVNAQLLATQALLDESARSEERLKLSRELHDVAGHKLTALKLNLARLGRDAALGRREDVMIAKQLADELLDDIRAVVSELRKHDGVDLRAALDAMTQQIPGPSFEVDIADDARVESVQTAQALLRCAQEGITNALRHGRPSRIVIECRRRDGAFELRVRDDGSRGPSIRFGNGLNGMQERLEVLGGTLRVVPAAGRGVELVANVPASR